MSKVSVRYIVTDVDAAIAFYKEMLGFSLDIHPPPGFARLAKGDLLLLLNRPGAGGAGQTTPDSQVPAPGGWNRIQIEVNDLVATVRTLKGARCRFRSDIVHGNGGKQALLEDPSGNLIQPHRALRAGGAPYEPSVDPYGQKWHIVRTEVFPCARS